MSSEIQRYNSASAQLSAAKSAVAEHGSNSQRAKSKSGERSLERLQREINKLERIPEGQRSQKQEQKLKKLVERFLSGFVHYITSLSTQGLAAILGAIGISNPGQTPSSGNPPSSSPPQHFTR